MGAGQGARDVPADGSNRSTRFVPSRDLPLLGVGKGKRVASFDAIVDGITAVALALGVAPGQEEQIVVEVATDGALKNGAQEDDDDDDDDDDDFEMHFVRQWLLRLSCIGWSHAECVEEESECEKMDDVLAEASRLIAILSGQSASGAMHKCYHFKADRGRCNATAASEGRTSVRIGETALVEDALGGRTWFAAPLLADYVAKLLNRATPSYEPRSVLELGAGTGLTGLTLAACLAQQSLGGRVHLTDMNADVLANLRRNVDRNGWTLGNEAREATQDVRGAVDVEVHKLHWGEHAKTSGNDAAQGSLLDTYDCILAADCVYDAQHAALLRQTAESFLTRQHAENIDAVLSGQRSSSHSHDMRGKVFLMTPQRLHHEKELASIEEQFPSLPPVTQPAARDGKAATMQLCTTRREVVQVHSGDDFGPPRLMSGAKRPLRDGDHDKVAGRTSCIKARQVLEHSLSSTIDGPLSSADGLYYRLHVIEWVRLAIE